MEARLVLRVPDEASRDVFAANNHIVMSSTNCSFEVTGGDTSRPAHSASSVVDGNELFMPLEGLISFEKEIARLEKEISNIAAYVSRLEKKLANKGFVDNAPPEVVEKERAKLEEARNDHRKLQANLEVLEG